MTTATNEGPGDRPLTTREWFRLACLGYADHRDRAPGRSCPAGDPLAPEVVAYWDGFQAATDDAIGAFVRARRQSRRDGFPPVSPVPAPSLVEGGHLPASADR